MTVDQEGNLHVSWYGTVQLGVDGSITTQQSIDTILDEDLLMYSQLSFDGEWSTPRDVQYTGRGGRTVRNALATTSDGMLHALYRTGSTISFASAPIVAATDARNWIERGNVADGGYYIDMLADDTDVLHVVYSGQMRFAIANNQTTSLEMNPCTLCGDPIYIRSVDGGKSWSFPESLSLTPGSGSDKIRLFRGNNGRIYLTWEEGFDWISGRGSPIDVRFVYTDDRGLTWSDPIILTGDVDAPAALIHFALAELRDGKLLAVWRYNNFSPEIYYQLSADVGQTWTKPEPIPGITNRSINRSLLDDYRIVVDQIGNAHLFVVGHFDDPNRRQNPALYQLTYSQSLWLPPRRIFYSPNEQPEWPQAVVGVNNDLHVTWFTRDIREDGPTAINSNRRPVLKVYYSHNTNLPTIRPTQAFAPTNTPLPTTTPVVDLDPTVTPFPTAPPDFVNVDVQNTDQYASRALLLAMGAVALVCAGVIFITRIGR